MSRLSDQQVDAIAQQVLRKITAGATVVLPVEVPGAGIYFGDSKAALGDGEIVCAPEAGTRIVASARPFDRTSFEDGASVFGRAHRVGIQLGGTSQRFGGVSCVSSFHYSFSEFAAKVLKNFRAIGQGLGFWGAQHLKRGE